MTTTKLAHRARPGRPRTARTPSPAVSARPDPACAAASPRPVTEAEIRAAIDGPVRHELGDLNGLLHSAFAPIDDSDVARTREPSGWDPDFFPDNAWGGGRGPHPGTFWADLTEAEGEELREAVWGGDLEGRLAPVIVEHVTTRVADFARRHPSLPRGRYAPSAMPAPAEPPAGAVSQDAGAQSPKAARLTPLGDWGDGETAEFATPGRLAGCVAWDLLTHDRAIGADLAMLAAEGRPGMADLLYDLVTAAGEVGYLAGKIDAAAFDLPWDGGRKTEAHVARAVGALMGRDVVETGQPFDTAPEKAGPTA